jgi:hypothetical protein
MITILEKHWLLISILLLLAILASFILWPSMAQTLSWMLAFSGVVLTIIFIARRKNLSYQQGRITRIAMIRDIVFELLGTVMAISVAVWLAGKATAQIIPAVYEAALDIHPGWVPVAGMLAGLVVALCVGLGVGLLMRWTWGRLTRKQS